MNNRIHDPLDHGFAVWENDTIVRNMMEETAHHNEWNYIVFPYIPTAENIARWAWEKIENDIEVEFGNDLKLYEVAVYETPTSVAYCRGVK